jgi:hypothetical protein
VSNEDVNARPHDTYYQACVGQWYAPFSIEITDRATFAKSYGALDRLSFWLLAIWPAWLGRVFLHTSVYYMETNEVLHTTRLRWFFVTMMSSTEVLVLGEDGASFTLDGQARLISSFWKTRHVHGSGVVAQDALHADYALTWLDAPLHQYTERDEDQLVLTMQGQGFLGAQPLRRVSRRPSIM